MILTTKLMEPRALVAHALREANYEYRGNLTVIETWQRGSRNRFVLRVSNSRAYGARKSWSGRHIKAASWEAHRDFMAAIFARDPNARLQTGMAVYRGYHGFMREYPATGDRNIGSQMCPCTMPELSIENTQGAFYV